MTTLFSIACFLILGAVILITTFPDELAEVLDGNEQKEEKNTEKKELSASRKLTILTCCTMEVGIILFWTRNVFLYPIIELFEKYPADKAVFSAAVMVLLATAYVIAMTIKVPRIAFLVGAFLANCLLVTTNPTVALAITFAFSVSVYSMILHKTVEVSAIEMALPKAMALIAVAMLILDKIGIIPGVLLMLAIISVITILSITIQVKYWKVRYQKVVIVSNCPDEPVNKTSIVPVEKKSDIISIN